VYRSLGGAFLLYTFLERTIEADTAANQTCLVPSDSQIILVRENLGRLVLTFLANPNENANTLRTFKVCTQSSVVLADSLVYVGSGVVDSEIYYVLELL
jgi:hypothetical protein